MVAAYLGIKPAGVVKWLKADEEVPSEVAEMAISMPVTASAPRIDDSAWLSARSLDPGTSNA